MTPTRPSAPVTLCVLLWARPGREAQLVAYEDAVLDLLGDHAATVAQRVRSVDADAGPYEVHVLTFRDQASYESYLADPRRLALQADRDAAIERTEIVRVDAVG